MTLLFLDTNTLWHRRIAEALAARVATAAVVPEAGLVPSVPRFSEAGPLTTFAIRLPRGWASGTADIGQRLLARLVRRLAASLGERPVLVFSSPAYRPLARFLGEHFPVVTYTADDYRAYRGWRAVAEAEAELARRAVLNVYVSEALRQRAIAEHGIDPARTLVSPNATEPRFATRPGGRPAELADRKRPVVGILGGLSERLDLDLVARVAALDRVGTLLVAGPVSAGAARRAPWLDSPKVVVTGPLPHDEMHRYAHAVDAGLIPYAPTALNHAASPMRLYDHLATGAPVFATNACDQINRLAAPGLTVLPPHHLVEAIDSALAAPARHERRADTLMWSARAVPLAGAIEAAA
ncbi:glycosyltransferase family protein [Acuticoccus mangrovi]|uniref:Uncharacterized protein n=1 Tax=Acuticoccus mangrovi TaxID=2796142 RepID=A0A934IPH4_9HYPH|nr:hypothetical protein [Acuticoccus mangrovi]MBJ3775927.1 hypothetical protein [Acuticoccus mangrovi]